MRPELPSTSFAQETARTDAAATAAMLNIVFIPIVFIDSFLFEFEVLRNIFLFHRLAVVRTFAEQAGNIYIDNLNTRANIETLSFFCIYGFNHHIIGNWTTKLRKKSGIQSFYPLIRGQHLCTSANLSDVNLTEAERVVSPSRQRASLPLLLFTRCFGIPVFRYFSRYFSRYAAVIASSFALSCNTASVLR